MRRRALLRSTLLAESLNCAQNRSLAPFNAPFAHDRKPTVTLAVVHAHLFHAGCRLSQRLGVHQVHHRARDSSGVQPQLVLERGVTELFGHVLSERRLHRLKDSQPVRRATVSRAPLPASASASLPFTFKRELDLVVTSLLLSELVRPAPDERDARSRGNISSVLILLARLLRVVASPASRSSSRPSRVT